MRSMSDKQSRFSVCAASVVLMIAVAGCENKKVAAPAKLNAKVETLELQAPDCRSPDECTSVTIRREVFTDRPALNDAIYAQLLKQLQGNGESGDAPFDSLDKVAEKFIADAAEVSGVSAAHWQLNGDAKKLSRRGDLLTIAVNSYLYTGGAHGMPVSHWLNWDLAEERQLTVNDVIRPGKEESLWQAVEEAYTQWLDSQNVDSEFRKNWPFTRSDDFRLTEEGLVLLYGVYTLGPYSMGKVELTVPRDKLTGLLRDPYL